MLSRMEFDESMQCEDADMAVKQLLDGQKLEYCPEARSGELAPVSLGACWKQRLRWNIGELQVVLKWARSYTKAGKMSCRGRCGLIWMQVVPYVLTAIGAGMACLPVIFAVWPLCENRWGRLVVRASQLGFLAVLGPWVFSTLEACFQIHHRRAQSCVQVLAVLLLTSPVGMSCLGTWNLTLTCVGVFKVFTGRVKGWEVAARAPSTSPGLRHGSDQVDQAKHVGEAPGASEFARTHSGSQTAVGLP